MGMVSRIANGWAEANRRYMASHSRASDVAGGLGAISKSFRMLVQSGVLAVGAWLVINQQASAGIIIAGSILSARALAPVDLAIANWKGFQAARQSWARLNRLLSLFPQQKEHDGAAGADGKSVGGEYRRGACPARRRSFCRRSASTFRPAAALASLGRARPASHRWRDCWSVCGNRCAAPCGSTAPRSINGCRKRSASISAICRRMWNCWPAAWRRISPGSNPARIPRRIVNAAKTAGVHDLIVRLPDGYETQVGEQGSALSSGQAQRIALARALYGDPFLVVLDEPNSNLDFEGDEALARAVMSVRKRGGIAIIVAHRPSALEAVDLILVMGNGRMQHPVGPKDIGAAEGATTAITTAATQSRARSQRDVPHEHTIRAHSRRSNGISSPARLSSAFWSSASAAGPAPRNCPAR